MLVFEKAEKNSGSDRKIINSIENLIKLNPTYDLKYLYVVMQYVLSTLVNDKYWFVYDGEHIFVTRISSYEHIAIIVDSKEDK